MLMIKDKLKHCVLVIISTQCFFIRNYRNTGIKDTL
jgi:hypothetical protein